MAKILWHAVLLFAIMGVGVWFFFGAAVLIVLTPMRAVVAVPLWVFSDCLLVALVGYFNDHMVPPSPDR